MEQQQVEQEEEEEEEDGVWPTDDDDDDDKGEFYDGSDASQPERSDALFCTRQAACLDEEVRRSRALPYHRSFRSSKPRPPDMGHWKQRIFVARSFRLKNHTQLMLARTTCFEPILHAVWRRPCMPSRDSPTSLCWSSSSLSWSS